MDIVIQIAVIDDNAQLRELSLQELKNAGFKLLFQADNEQQAIGKIESYGLPDVCIVEENLASAKLLLERYPDLKVLVSSTKDDKQNVADMLDAGVSGYVLKFADPDELVTAVKALAADKKYFSVGIAAIATEYFQ
ncbi:response regulator [Elizabethkingia anophelis]|uniref:Two component transcriptional regulator, LuxR family n=1 Tax=Elizabethkingia anophelis TaxID=1117645 RepID=A0A455ZC75_9FLAO|nr:MULTISPECIES: response regulator [Bacteroidota]ASV79748.1 DNA-binding response regulator [Elizabethkingia anophelis]MBB1642547.1 histidine kinase [Sphingobacterium sp. UME9]MDV3551397.1 response regulator [Elizabethkingia anophelis]MDV3569775.1 response regulator [Elizabethkingia anophelis]MDV3619320.1 response regulator [Elizabethkingia anophelis]